MWIFNCYSITTSIFPTLCYPNIHIDIPYFLLYIIQIFFISPICYILVVKNVDVFKYYNLILTAEGQVILIIFMIFFLVNIGVIKIILFYGVWRMSENKGVPALNKVLSFSELHLTKYQHSIPNNQAWLTEVIADFMSSMEFLSSVQRQESSTVTNWVRNEILWLGGL